MPGHGVVVALEGLSGSGKSAVAARAAARGGGVPLAEAWTRLEPRPDLHVRSPRSIERLERTLLSEECRRWNAARARADAGELVIADTGFLGPLTYTAGLVVLREAPLDVLRRLVSETRRRAARGEWGLPDLVVLLATSPAVRRRRVASDPVGHPPSLAARHESVGRVEEELYRRAIAPALRHRWAEVDGNRGVDPVVRSVLRYAGRIAPRPPRDRSALALLDRLSPPEVRTTAAPATVKKGPLTRGAPRR